MSRGAHPFPTATLEQVVSVDPAIVRGYARGVADELGRGPLTLDRRDRLLGRAKHLGLGRFEAALILAVVEREQPEIPRPSFQRAQTPTKWPTLGLACAVQAIIVATAWWFVF